MLLRADPPHCFVRANALDPPGEVAFNSYYCDRLPQFCQNTECSDERGCLCWDQTFGPSISPSPTPSPTPMPTNATIGACPRAEFNRWPYSKFYELECLRWLVLRDDEDNVSSSPPAPLRLFPVSHPKALSGSRVSSRCGLTLHHGASGR